MRYWPVDQAFPRTRETTLLRAKPKAHRHTQQKQHAENRPSLATDLLGNVGAFYHAASSEKGEKPMSEMLVTKGIRFVSKKSFVHLHLCFWVPLR